MKSDAEKLKQLQEAVDEFLVDMARGGISAQQAIACAKLNEALSQTEHE